MNDSQVALHTDQDVQKWVSKYAQTKNICSHERREWKKSNDAAAREDQARQTEKVCEDEVVGEEVGMARCHSGAPPPATDANVDDEKAEREDQQDVDDSEQAQADNSIPAAEAP